MVDRILTNKVCGFLQRSGAPSVNRYRIEIKNQQGILLIRSIFRLERSVSLDRAKATRSAA